MRSEGYQPEKSNTDPENPPQGSSGVNPLRRYVSSPEFSNNVRVAVSRAIMEEASVAEAIHDIVMPLLWQLRQPHIDLENEDTREAIVNAAGALVASAYRLRKMYPYDMEYSAIDHDRAAIIFEMLDLDKPAQANREAAERLREENTPETPASERREMIACGGRLKSERALRRAKDRISSLRGGLDLGRDFHKVCFEAMRLYKVMLEDETEEESCCLKGSGSKATRYTVEDCPYHGMNWR